MVMTVALPQASGIEAAESKEEPYRQITSPGGAMRAGIPDPETAPDDLDYHFVVWRGGEVVWRRLLSHTGTSDFEARWSPDEKLIAVHTWPLPRHYEVFVFDLENRRELLVRGDETTTRLEEEALRYFKGRAPEMFAAERPAVTLAPEQWKDNRTLVLRFRLHPWTPGGAGQAHHFARAEARLENGGWRLGPLYDFKVEPEIP